MPVAIGEDAEPLTLAIGEDAEPIAEEKKKKPEAAAPRIEEIKPTPDDWHTALAALSRSTDEILAPGSKYQTELVSPEVAHAAASYVAAPARLVGKVLGGRYQAIADGMQSAMADVIGGQTLESLAALPSFAVPGVAETFAVNTAAKLPEQYGRIKESIKKNGVFSAETARVAVASGVQDLMGLLALHSTPKVRDALREGIKNDITEAQPKPNETPTNANVAPTQPQQIIPQDFVRQEASAGALETTTGSAPGQQAIEPARVETTAASTPGQQQAIEPGRVVGAEGFARYRAPETVDQSAQGDGGTSTGEQPAPEPVERPASEGPGSAPEAADSGLAEPTESTAGSAPASAPDLARPDQGEQPGVAPKAAPGPTPEQLAAVAAPVPPEPVTLTGYRGSPKGPTTAGQAHGVGTYYGLTEEVANRFSKSGTVKSEPIELQNPLVIKSDAELRQARESVGVTSDPRMLLSKSEAQQFTKGLQAAGHDGVVIDYSKAPGGKQVVVFPPAAEAAAARVKRAPAPDGEFTDHPIIQYIVGSGGMVSRSRGLQVLGKEKFAANKSLWDSAPALPDPRQSKIYGANSRQTPDMMAADLVNAGLLPEGSDASSMFDKIQKIADASHRQAKSDRLQGKAVKLSERQARSFTRAIAKPQKGEYAIAVSDLKVGDQFKVNDEPVTVKSIDPETFDVEMEDGTQFGVQHVTGDAVIYGEMMGKATKKTLETRNKFNAGQLKIQKRYFEATTAAKDAEAIEMRSPTHDKIRVIITKDVPTEGEAPTGKWRATRISTIDNEPLGHNVYDTKNAAIADYVGKRIVGPPWGHDFKVTQVIRGGERIEVGSKKAEGRKVEQPAPIVPETAPTGPPEAPAVPVKREFPSYTSEQLRGMLATADPATRARIAAELGNRASGASKVTVTPQIAPGFDKETGMPGTPPAFQATDTPGSFTPELIQLSADIKAERTAQQQEQSRQQFADAHGRKPWAVSLAYGDLEKVMLDLDKGRVTKAELWNAADGGRNSGTLDPQIAMRLYEALSKQGEPPKLRAGEQGTGEMFQGADQPFNLAGEETIDAEAAAKEAELQAQMEQEKRIFEEENQVPFGFGPGAAAAGENLNVAPQIAQLNATVSTALRTANPFSMTRRFKRAFQAIGGKGVTAKQNLAGGIQNVRAAWQTLKNIMLRPPTLHDFVEAIKDWHFADNKTSFYVRKFVRDVRKEIKDPLVREGITNYIQADGDMALLAKRAQASNIKYRPGYEAAMHLTPEQRTFAANIRQYFDAMLLAGQKAGLIEHGIENYVNQLWKRPNRLTRQMQADIQSGKLQTSFQFARRRIFDSFFEGEQKGYIPASKDISALIAVYDQGFNKALSARAFVNALREVKSKVTGKVRQAVTPGGEALVKFSGSQTRIEPKEGEGAGAYLVRATKVPELAVAKDGRAYIPVDHPALRGWRFVVQEKPGDVPVYYQTNMLVHPDYAGHLKNLLEPSMIRANKVGKFALNVGAYAKQSKLSLSLFHLDQEGLHGLFHRLDPAHLKPIDFDDPVQASLIRNGVVVADYRAQELYTEGLAGGGWVAHTPILGRMQAAFNEYLFKDYIPKLKMNMAVEAYGRNLKRYGGTTQQVATGTVRTGGQLTPEQIAEITARQANAAFGELNYRLLGRSQTLQDFMRLTILAPDFLEARSRFVGQAMKRYGREQQVALILGSAQMYAGARIMNQVLNGDAHWDKPFSLVYHGREYRLRTVMGDVVELATDPFRFAGNRLSFWLKEGITVATGRDMVTGLRLTRFEQLKHALAWNVPITSPVKFGLDNSEPQTGMQRILGGVGVSNKPARGAIDDAYDMALEYRKEIAKTDPKVAAEIERASQETYVKGDYARLNRALYENDREKATAEIERLIEQKGSAMLEKYYDNLPDKTFTGSAALESDWLLNVIAKDPGKAARYNQAIRDREGIADLFFALQPYARPKSDRSLTH